MGRRRQGSKRTSGIAMTQTENIFMPTLDEDKENAEPSINLPVLSESNKTLADITNDCSDDARKDKLALVLDAIEVTSDVASTTAASTPSSMANPVSPTEVGNAANSVTSASEGESVKSLLNRMPPPLGAPTIMPLSMPTLPPCPPGNALVAEPWKQLSAEESRRETSVNSYREKLRAAGVATISRNPLLERFASPQSLDSKVGDKTPTVQTLGLVEWGKRTYSADCSPGTMAMPSYQGPSPHHHGNVHFGFGIPGFPTSPEIGSGAPRVPLDLANVISFAPSPAMPMMPEPPSIPMVQPESCIHSQTTPGLLSMLMPDAVAGGFSCNVIAEQLRAAEPCSYDD